MASRSRSQASTPSEPRRLSGEDAIFVHAETPTMLMHTLGTLILDPATVPGGHFNRAHIISHVKKRIHLMPPFRQRLLEVPFSLGSPVLADDPDFRVEDHVFRTVARRPGTMRELAEVVEEIAVKPLDRSKPLWEMWLVDGLEDGRRAVVTKLHHCMIDGASGASQMANLLDFEAGASSPPAPPFHPGPLPSGWELLSSSLANRRDPRDLVELARSSAVSFLENVWAGGVASLFPDSPTTPWSRSAGTDRCVAFGSAPLDDLKLVKNAFGVTINDAVLAACTLALRRYLEARNALPVQPLTCAVPVSVKSDAELRQFSNKVSVMTVHLPTHLADPADIVRRVQEETELAKRAFEASHPEIMIGWLDWAPGPMVHAAAQLFTSLKLADRLTLPWNCVVSNMRGAPIPLYFAGAQVLATFPMGPVADGVGLNITVLSNMGRLDFGVVAARDTVPDVWDLAEGFGAAVTELRVLAEQRGATDE